MAILFESGYFIIPKAYITAALTDYVYKIDLSRMIPSWWDKDISPDGGNLRLYAGSDNTGIAVPLDIVTFDLNNKTGEAYFVYAATSLVDNEFFLDVVPSAVKPAHTDPLGRNAVWKDYYATYIAVGDTPEVDRSGNCPDLTFYNHTMTIDPDGFVLTGAKDFAKTTIDTPPGRVYSIAASFTPILVTGVVGDRGVVSLVDRTTTTGFARSSGIFREMLSSAYTWFSWGSQNVAIGRAAGTLYNVEYTITGTLNGPTGARAIYKDATLIASDPTSSGDIWASTVSPLDLNLGCHISNDINEPTIPAPVKIKRVTVRKDVATPERVATEVTQWSASGSLVPYDPSPVAFLGSYEARIGSTLSGTIPDVFLGYVHPDRRIILAISVSSTYGRDMDVIERITLGGFPVNINVKSSRYRVIGASSDITNIIANATPNDTRGDLVIYAAGGATLHNITVAVYATNVPSTFSKELTAVGAGLTPASVTTTIPENTLAVFTAQSGAPNGGPFPLIWTGDDLEVVSDYYRDSAQDCQYGSAFIPVKESATTVTVTAAASVATSGQECSLAGGLFTLNAQDSKVYKGSAYTLVGRPKGSNVLKNTGYTLLNLPVAKSKTFKTTSYSVLTPPPPTYQGNVFKTTGYTLLRAPTATVLKGTAYTLMVPPPPTYEGQTYKLTGYTVLAPPPPPPMAQSYKITSYTVMYRDPPDPPEPGGWNKYSYMPIVN